MCDKEYAARFMKPVTRIHRNGVLTTKYLHEKNCEKTSE